MCVIRLDNSVYGERYYELFEKRKHGEIDAEVRSNKPYNVSLRKNATSIADRWHEPILKELTTKIQTY